MQTLVFDNRQLATLILLGIAAVFAFIYLVRTNSGRKSLANFVKQLLSFKILPIFILYGAWLLALHYLAWRVSLWDARLIGESLFLSGAVISLLFAVTEAEKNPRFFRTKLFDTIKIGVFFEFFINIKPLSLWLELILLPTLAFLVFTRVVSEGRAEHAPAHRLFTALIVIIRIGLIVYVAHWLAKSWGQFDTNLELLKFLMPIWLAIGVLPFIYLFALIMGYELIFKFMKPLPREERRPAPMAAKLGVMFALRGSVRQIHLFRPHASYYGKHIQNFREGMAAVRNVLAQHAEREAEEQAARDRLEEYAGVDGVDEDGRRLDQREFEETKHLLQNLAGFQKGWYSKNGNRYRSDLLDLVTSGSTFDQYNLPGDHGTTMKVRSDGKAWYAYRRTVTGWVFGIGAKHDPSDQWFYEGPEFPGSFPKKGNGWGEGPHIRTVNWE